MAAVSRMVEAQKPATAAHYSPAVAHNGLIYISGQLPIHASGTAPVEGGFEAQARFTIEKLLALLHQHGGAPASLLKVSVYLVGIENWPLFNRLYAEMLGTARPARSVVPVPELHHGCLIEIDAIAAQVAPPA